MTRRRTTLRRRLTLVTAGALAVALTIGAVLLVQVVTAQRVESLDEAVAARVAAVHELVVTDRVPQSLAVVAPGEVVQVLAPDGAVLATSPNASLTLPVVDLGRLTDDGVSADPSAPTVVSAPSPYADGPARVALVRVGADDVPEVWRTAAADGEVLVVAAVPQADVAATARTLSLLLAGVVPVLVLLLGAVLWVVLGRALRGVEDLRAAADDVAASGGPGSLPVPATGELAALAVTLNSMLDRLEVASAAERAAARSARAAAERQRAFVADAAHELRSPIASLVTSLEVARRHPQAYPSAELVADLEADTARLRTLVEDLLLLAKVGSRPLARTELDLAEIAATVVAALDGAAPEPAGRDDAAVVVVVDGAGRALGDPDAVDRVLRNLVGNARRHARTRVRVAVGPGSVVVDDDGEGIAAGQRERVFERFVRLDEARERDAGGSGLGLAIARELARELGGDVELDDAPTGGLRARLRLPVPPA